MFIKKSDLDHFTEDNTITTFCKDLDPLIHIPTEESESAIAWFHNNNMIVNTGNFQALIVNLPGKSEKTYNIPIQNKEISFTTSVTLFGLQIDKKLTSTSIFVHFESK